MGLRLRIGIAEILALQSRYTAVHGRGYFVAPAESEPLRERVKRIALRLRRRIGLRNLVPNGLPLFIRHGLIFGHWN